MFSFFGEMEDKLSIQINVHLFWVRLFCAEAISPVSSVFLQGIIFPTVLCILLYMWAFQLNSGF